MDLTRRNNQRSAGAVSAERRFRNDDAAVGKIVLQAMLAHLVVDAARRDAEQPRGFRLVSVGCAQRRLDQRPFARGERARKVPPVEC